MPDNFEKLWIQRNLNILAQNRALEAIEGTGRALPCSVVEVNGALVLVKFEANGPWTLPQLWLPKAESQWLRAPVQVGDVGMTVPADTYLGGISGQGGGVADLTVQYGNLTTLAFIPIAAVAFQVTPDANKVWLNGPNGVLLSSSIPVSSSPVFGTVGVSCDATLGLVTIYAGEQTFVITADPSIVSTVTGTLGSLQTVVDGPTNAISQVVPAGGLVGLGSLATSIASTQAASAQADLQTLANNVVAQSLQTLAAGIGTAAVTAAIPNAAAFAAILSAAGFATGLSGINPTIPDCSSIVRIAP